MKKFDIKNLCIFCALLLISTSIKAQDISAVWTLEDCIAYAKEHSIQIQKSKIAKQSSEEDWKAAKASLFPTLSASTSQTWSGGKSPNASGNYRYESTFAGRYNLNASATLYDGGKNVNRIKQNKLLTEADELAVYKAENDIEISITETYLQILYAKESIKIMQDNITLSQQQLDRSEKLLAAGTITRSDLAQVQSQLSSDKYNLITAQNSHDTYLLQLKQLLELEITDSLNIYYPKLGDESVLQVIPSKYNVYEKALQIMPEVQASDVNLKIAEYEKSNAKAGYYPTVSASAAIGTSNIYGEDPSFWKQLDRNFGQNAGLTLSIPIFDGRTNKTNVRKANLAYQTAELNKIETQKTLLKTVESLYQDAVSAQSNYMASKEKLNSSDLSYKYVQERYNLGMKNTVDLLTAKNNYQQALQDVLQAKYQAILSLKLLKFYQGEAITL